MPFATSRNERVWLALAALALLLGLLVLGGGLRSKAGQKSPAPVMGIALPPDSKTIASSPPGHPYLLMPCFSSVMPRSAAVDLPCPRQNGAGPTTC